MKVNGIWWRVIAVVLLLWGFDGIKATDIWVYYHRLYAICTAFMPVRVPTAGRFFFLALKHCGKT